jgi:hypothetical protein
VKIKSILVGLLGVALAGCSDDPVSPTGTVSGSLSFNYTGAGTTSSTAYSASGNVPTNVGTTFGTSSWAAAGVDATAGETAVIASVPKTTTTWDLTVITAARTTTGTSNINANCTANACTTVTVFFGSNQSETAFTFFCELTSGTVNITAISSTNVTGTFSGSGTCETPTGASTPFTVTNGTFNTGISTQL